MSSAAGVTRAGRPVRSRGERRVMLGAVSVALLVASPVIAIFVIAVFPQENIWPHLIATVLPGYIRTTVELMLGVGLVSFVVGTGTAWLVTMYSFPGRRLFEWLLLIPLAMPTYIIAYAYVDVLEYSGFAQSLLRGVFGWTSARDYWFPEIRSLGGAVAVMALVLYPYVYLTARAAFVRQSLSLLEASRTLGRPIGASFRLVALPLARPAIAVGIVLALMECLNDIGAVQYFGVNTLTVGVYVTWLQKNNLGGAAQIAVVMLIFVFALIWLERRARRGRRFHQGMPSHRVPARVSLSGARAIGATIACVTPILLGFVIPGATLVDFALRRFGDHDLVEFATRAFNSLTLAVIAAAITVLIGLFLAHAVRLSRTTPVRAATLAASVGYAVPGAVLAIGILVPLARFDNALDGFARDTFGVATGLLLTGTIFSVVFAYVVRFMAISYGAIDAGFSRISPNLSLAARSLGRSPLAALGSVQLPLLKPAIASAALLVFVDSMKELPATLLLRPFNFDTLATHVYTYASLGVVEDAALSALAIVAVGVLPVLALNRTMTSGAIGAAVELDARDKVGSPG